MSVVLYTLIVSVHKGLTLIINIYREYLFYLILSNTTGFRFEMVYLCRSQRSP